MAGLSILKNVSALMDLQQVPLAGTAFIFKILPVGEEHFNDFCYFYLLNSLSYSSILIS